MTSVLRGVTALWIRFCAWRASYWLEAWKGRQEAAELARAQYQLWLSRAGVPSPLDKG